MLIVLLEFLDFHQVVRRWYVVSFFSFFLNDVTYALRANHITYQPKQASSDPRSLSIFPGGKGANQAAGVASFESKSFFIGRIGDDADADIIQEALNGKVVDVSCMPRNSSVPSGKAFIFLEPDGSNSIVIVQGANIEGWIRDERARYLSDRECEIISNSSCLMLQREIPDEVNVEAAKVAREHDIPVLLDVGGKDTPIDPNLAPLVDIIWPNETELSNICGGVPTDTDEDIFNAAKMLREQGMKDVLVTIGEKGSIMIPFDDPDNVTRGHSYRVDSVVDTTGAGDCFRAAFATARFCDNRNVKDSLQFASAASALLVQRLGAMSAPSHSEIINFLSSSSSSSSS